MRPGLLVTISSPCNFHLLHCTHEAPKSILIMYTINESRFNIYSVIKDLATSSWLLPLKILILFINTENFPRLTFQNFMKHCFLSPFYYVVTTRDALQQIGTRTKSN